MICPGCRVEDDRVVDSRFSGEGNTIRRRRECSGCGFRYTTYERIEESLMQVVKSGGVRQPWNRQKLLEGVRKATEKRPVDTEQLEALIDEVQRSAFRAAAGGEISTTSVGEFVMTRLRALDPVAYVRFASVYMKINNIDDLLDEIQEVRQTAPPPEEPDQGQLFL